MWPNFGVIVAYTFLYILVTVIATETLQFQGDETGSIVFKSKKQSSTLQHTSEETETKKGSTAQAMEKSSGNDIFTFRDIEYTVSYGDGQRKLLNKVTGYVKSGSMVALMGSSGAGKTTLLNTLAQRQKTGITSGDMLVNGLALPPGFQRMTGFCEQMDLHDETATVREAFEFSALLRQGREVPSSEKINYVKRIIDLLELTDLQNAIISSLSVEQKKRVTIGVELSSLSL